MIERFRLPGSSATKPTAVPPCASRCGASQQRTGSRHTDHTSHGTWPMSYHVIIKHFVVSIRAPPQHTAAHRLFCVSGSCSGCVVCSRLAQSTHVTSSALKTPPHCWYRGMYSCFLLSTYRVCGIQYRKYNSEFYRGASQAKRISAGDHTSQSRGPAAHTGGRGVSAVKRAPV